MTKSKGSRGKSAPEEHLPKQPPKKTGRRGIGPKLDPEKDFDQPVKKAAENDQPELLEVPKEKVPTVVNGRFLASYLKPIFSKAPKTGQKLLALQMSLSLSDDHKTEKLFPSMVMDTWKFMRKHGRKQVSLTDLPGQNVRIYLASDDKEEIIGMPIAKMVNTNLAVVQKKGEGEALRVIQLKFRLQVEFNREIAKFAESNYGNSFWLDMKQAQGEMFEDTEEE